MDNQYASWMPMGEPLPDAALKQKAEDLVVKILIAEDDDTIRRMLKRSLTDDKYRIVEAVDGEEAWQCLQDKEDPPRVAILDWMMPKIDGLTLCRKIKARKDPFIFTIMLTARVSDRDVTAAILEGADDYISKPFNLELMRSRVAAGVRIIRLEKLLVMKDSILEFYKARFEELAGEPSR